MNLSPAVKKKAIDAVSAPETQAWLAAFGRTVEDVSPESLFTRAEPPDKSGTVPLAKVRELARDAVSAPEVKAWVRQIEHDGEIHCPFTFQPANARMAGKVVREYEAGQPLDSTHKNITRDHFGMEYV